MNNVFKKLGVNNVLSLIDEMTLYKEKFQNGEPLEVGPYSLDAFVLLRFLLERTVGTDKLRSILSKLLIYIVPELEIAIKTLLLIHLKSLRPCSISETLLIPDKYVREGIFITKGEIDQLNLLSKNPISSNNKPFTNSNFQDKHYYFGNDEMNLVSELKDSPDLNAFIWYVLNISNEREAWYGTNIFSDLKLKKNDIKKNLPKRDASPFDKFGNVINRETFNQNRNNQKFIEDNQPYFHSIFTLKQTGGDRTDIEGNNIYGSLSPNSNKGIHFFFGNALEKEYFKREAHQNELLKIKRRIHDYNTLIENDNDQIYALSTEKDDLLSKIIDIKHKSDLITFTSGEQVSLKEVIEDQIKVLDKKIEALKRNVEQNKAEIEKLKQELQEKENSFTPNNEYRPSEENYYFRKPTVLFNYHYVMGTKFLDENILASQIVDNILNMKFNVSFSGSATYREYMLEQELFNIINSVIETDDAVVSDCFFDFSNEKHNEMLNRTEEFLKNNNNINYGHEFREDISKIFENVDNINKTSSLHEKTEIIEGLLSDINRLDFDYKKKEGSNIDFNLGVKTDSFNDIIKQFTFVIIRSILTPKLMLLSIVNRRMNGEYTSVSLIEWIKSLKDLLIALVRKVKDMICSHLLNELIEILRPLAIELNFQYAIEALNYYKMALLKAIDCINLFAGAEYLPFDMDRDVNADIYNSKIAKNNNC